MVEHCFAMDELAWQGRVIIGLAHMGLRISELAALRWSDIDLASKTIQIAEERSSHRKQRSGSARTTKGRRWRTAVPIKPFLAAPRKARSATGWARRFKDGRAL